MLDRTDLSVEQLQIVEIDDYAGYQRHVASTQTQRAEREALLRGLMTKGEVFDVGGFCFVCGRPSSFRVTATRRAGTEQIRRPNWRESVVCPGCGLNNRLRASFHLFEQVCSPKPMDRIYITEQTTRLYHALKRRYPGIVGSEYLADSVAHGTTDAKGIRNESLTRLTFSDRQFTHILTFDVLEHLPDTNRALRECFRCLAPGGYLVLSAPFLANVEDTLVRARIRDDGTTELLLEPEYHGDPLASAGCLCYYHFGWDLLAKLKDAGFSSARALLYWSSTLGYLGAEQIVFVAQK